MTLDRVFSQEDMDRIRRGVVPETMDDKWFIYWTEDALYFHRSWTGCCTIATSSTSGATATGCVSISTG